GIGEQQHGRVRGPHRDDLADQSAGVDHALAHCDAIATAGIEDQALPGGVQVDVEDWRELYIQAAALGCVEQATQTRVLGGGGLQACDACTADEQRVAQHAVLV